jgi:demethylmenaquinone methyltransferase/2-methoxy-6-polyprenyl-1,4-benzoquinol methylase
MFDDIAEKYDLLNHLFTFNLDKKWRRNIIRKIRKNNIKKDIVLDLASGTGDLARELLSLESDMIYSCDISLKMLEVQEIKLRDTNVIMSQANAEELPYENESIDIVTIGFGVRNFDNLRAALKEISRVLKYNGLLVILEMFSHQKMKNGFYNFYFNKFIPAVGNKISKSKYAYNYLFNSVDKFHTSENFVNLCEELNYELIDSKNNFAKIVNTFYFKKI